MSSGKNPFLWCSAALAVFGALALATWQGIALEIAMRIACSVVGLASAVPLWRASRLGRGQEGPAFRILSIGLVAWSLGIAVHLVDLLQGSFKTNYPPADAFFLVAAACSLVGMARLPTAQPLAKARRILILDQSIAAIASGAIFWHLVLAPNLGRWGDHHPTQIAMSLLYMVVEFVILQMAIDLVVRGPSRQELKSVYWMASAGFLSLLAGNVLMEFDFWREKGLERHHLHLTNLGFALAMAWASGRLLECTSGPPSPPSRWLALRESLVPLAWVALPSFAFAWILLVGGLDSSWDLLLVTIVLVVLVVVRQRMAERRLAADLRSTLLASLLPAILGLQLLAMLTACLVLGATFQMIASEAISQETSRLAIAIENREILADSGGQPGDSLSWRIVERGSPPGSLPPKRWNQTSGLARIPDSGSLSPRLVAWRDLDSQEGFRLVATASQSLYTGTSRNAGSVILLLSLLVAGITTWMVAIKARNLSQPLEALTRAASDVQEGDLAVRTGLSGIDEVSRLGQAMDAMVERLSQMLEEQRELAQKAKEASLAKSRFLANMSHEIRTPLNGILGIADLLATSEIPASDRGLVEDLRTSAANLRDLVGDILDLSKIEAERILLESVRFRPAELLGQVAGLFGPAANAKKISLVSRWEGDDERSIAGDQVRIRQILSNLVSNAVKFTSEGGISIRGRIEEGEPSRLVFEVEDTGAGIAPQSQGRIWQEFAQADESTTRKYGGTGLGLSISRSLARLMGGELSLVRSALGEGSRFALEIPLSEPVPDGPHRAPATVPGATAGLVAGLRVLVAEDNAVNQKVIQGFLQRLGCDSRLVGDGIEAVVAAREMRPDLVLMDVHMPRMDGLVAAREMRRDGYDGRIWALTASAMSAEFDRCMEAGMDGFLSKPIGLSDLREMLLKEFAAKPAEASLRDHPLAPEA